MAKKKTTKKTTKATKKKATKKKAAKKVTKGEGDTDTVAVPVEWHYPEGHKGHYANHIWVQYDGHEYHLSFFDLKPPMTMGTAEERRNQLENLESVRAECVARIVISKSRMEGFVEAIKSQYEKHAEKEEKDESNDERSA